MHSIRDLNLIKTILSSVPKENWIEDDYTDGIGKCCAIGHYSRIVNDRDNYCRTNCYKMENSLDDELIKDIIKVNDGLDSNYQQDNPKDRVMNWLIDELSGV